MLFEIFVVWLLAVSLLMVLSFIDNNPALGIIAGALLLLLGLIVFADNIQVKTGESIAYLSQSQGNMTNTYSPLAFSPPASTQTVVALPLMLTGIGVTFTKVVGL